MAAQESVPERRKRFDDLPELPEGRPALLLSSIYSGEERKPYLKFYDPQQNVIYHWRDRTGHTPYAYTKMQYEDLVNQIAAKEPKYAVQHTRKRDVIADQEIEVLKVTAPDPLSIGGTDNSLRERVKCWECYDSETEILTKEGWKRHYQIHNDEIVATYNSNLHKFEWQQIEAKVEYDYNGDMYGLHAKTIDLLVTPNHRIFLWNENRDVTFLTATELYQKYPESQASNFRAFPSGLSIHKTATAGFDGDGNNGDRFALQQSSWRCSKIDIPIEEFVEFLGWFIAEGGVGGKGNETYIDLILSSAKDPWQHLKDMIESWGVKVWVGNQEETHTIKLVFSAKDLAQWLASNCYTGSIHRSYYKRVPALIKNLPARYLRIFIRSLFLGDGSLRDGESGQLKSVSEVLADDIQEIACKCGYSATITQKPRIVDNRGWKFADSYVITLSSHRTRTNPSERISKQQYVGKVWCVKVPNGIIYVRRNKKPYWCGNSDIKYHENYLYDNSLIVGAYYVRHGDAIEPYAYKISDKVEGELKSLLWDKIKEEGESGKEYRQYVTSWANLLNQPIPELRRVAVDIEVEAEEGRMPTPRDHDRRVTAVGFAGNDGLRKVLVLEGVNDDGTPLIPQAELCKSEKELLEKAFAIINSYPIIITFNGDDFDLPYLYARSQDPRIDTKEGKAIPKDTIPIIVKKESFIRQGGQTEPVGIRHGIHLDLYRTFKNPSLQIYAFSRKYTEFTLNAICEALLEDSKLEFEGDISELPMQKLAEYCLKDADLTFRLTSFGDNVLMKLLVVIARIGRMAVDDISRFYVNQWIRGVLYYEHRQRHELIPRSDELTAKGSASTAAVIKEKKYRGGEVVEPTPGIHFNVVVLDFASLYPSIIKVHNLSYETINCVHEKCKETGRIEGTTHWVCQQRKGLSSLLIGSLRDLRVNYYKHLSKDKALPAQERQLYNVVSQAIKVILNACFTADTDVLTPDGMRKVTELKVGDKVYTLNEETHKVEIKPVVEVQHYIYNDSLVEIKSKDIDWQVTGNHKLYLGRRFWARDGATEIRFSKDDAFEHAKRNDKRFLFRHEQVVYDNAELEWLNLWKYVPNELENTIIIKPNRSYERKFADSSRFAHYEFANKLRRCRGGRYYLTSKTLFDELSISPEEFEKKYNCKIFVKNYPAKTSSYTKWSFKASAIFELVGWYVTEGHARIGKSRHGYNFTRIAISQDAKHSANVGKITSMIQDLGINAEKPSAKVLSFSSHIIANFLLSECGTGSRHKHLPSFVFPAPVQLRRLLFETMMCGDGNIDRGVYSTISRRLADDFRHLAFTLGIETSLHEETLTSASKIYRVKLFRREHHIVTPDDFKLRPVKELDVYCITAQDNHIIYAGRNGKLGWIGQSYGVMGAEIFPLYCLPVADATAAIGRTTINKTINKCKELGIEVVYGDSVLPDTPIIIKRKDGNIDIVPIESLMPKTVSANRYDKFGDLQVLTETGFTKIKYIYRHKVRKKGYRILSRKGFVECTEDHSLVINGKETKPSSLKIGDKIQVVPFKAASNVNVNPELAWLFGFFIAEGTCGSYAYDKPFSHTKNSWRIVNQDIGKLERAKKVMQESLALPTTITDIRESSATYALVPRDNTKLLVDYFRSMCYRGTEKAIPQCILNANPVTKKAFIEGILAGDGHMDTNGLVTIDQIHKTVQAGLVAMLEDLGFEYSLQIRSDKANVCRIRVIRDNADLRIKPADEIKKIEEFEIDGYVYDLETENHHFCGGIGNVLLHNTDSLFLKEPSKEAIDKVVCWAKDNLGVDLEIDKQYRYVVFSDLKKNYLGVLPDGTVDVKGLTGKKSHTPPFIRSAFYEILAILGKVNSQKDFESAKESIKNIIQRDAKNLEARKIPIQDLSFNVMINKSISSYGKKVSNTTTVDGKGATQETFKGLPQHIKAARLLADKREIKAGDIISYVKTKGGDGVKPVELAKADEIDNEKYFEAMESTFDQVLSTLNFDFKAMLGKPRQQSLDELFWSKPSM